MNKNQPYTLLNEFSEMLSECTNQGKKKIKLAYFTSFLLDVSFFEKYLLSKLLGIEDIPFNQSDYEEMNDKLGESKIDLKIFYDARGIDLHRPKRTCISLHPINVKVLNNEKFQKGIFHPKVVLLKNESDEFYLWVASANLTTKAWAQNRECFYWSKVNSNKNMEEIYKFFSSFTEIEKSVFKGTTKNNKSDTFEFIHNFSDPILSKINLENKELTVWSPYFSDNMQNLILNSSLSQSSKIKIIPDLQDDRKIRMKKENLENLTKLKNISFHKNLYYQRKGEKNETDIFNHSKVWMTDDTTAIGSWNFTSSALCQGERWNVEAGIIIKDIKFTFELKEITETLEENLESDELEEIVSKELPEFNICVSLDWSTYKFKVNLKWDEKWKEKIKIKLPSLDSFISINQADCEIPADPQKRKELINDKMYILRVEDKDYRGFIIDENLSNRPSFEFTSLNELLRVLGSKKELKGNTRTIGTVDFLEDLDVYSTNSSTTKEDGLNYYIIFQSFNNMNQTINKLQKENNYQDKIRYIAQKKPGNIYELHEKLKNSEESNTILKWFLVKEYNNYLYKFKTINIDIDSYELKSDFETFKDVLDTYPNLEKYLKDLYKENSDGKN